MSSTRLKEGDDAPNFSLQSQTGEPWELKAALERGPVLVYFYPKDETPVCTKQACGFRDAYEDFTKQGVEVVGISRDSAGAHQSFAEHHKLPFTLLSDPDGQVRGLFGVKKTLGLFDGRVSFLIDRHGKIRFLFASALNANAHVRRALEAAAVLGRS
ncbi:MAG TPA: peroxiredoxin [Polyangiaceae bacterium]|jgi:peroxiredoxin Q/BCP